MEYTLRICESSTFEHWRNSERIREELCDHNENVDTRGQARDVLNAIQRVSLLSFLHFRKDVQRKSHDLQHKGLWFENCAQKMKAFVAFLSDERDALATQSVDNALKICEKLEIAIEERRIRRTKRMPGEQSQDVYLFLKKLKDTCYTLWTDFLLKQLTFWIPLHCCKAIKMRLIWLNFKAIYVDEVDLSELP